MMKLKQEAMNDWPEFKTKEKAIRQLEMIENLAKSTLIDYEKYFQVDYFDKLKPREVELNELTIHDKIKEVLAKIKT